MLIRRRVKIVQTSLDQMTFPNEHSISSPGVQCGNCGVGLVLEGDLNAIRFSFEVTCPMCGETRTYQHIQVHTFDAVPK
jgi:ribosomal protein S27E